MYVHSCAFQSRIRGIGRRNIWFLHRNASCIDRKMFKDCYQSPITAKYNRFWLLRSVLVNAHVFGSNQKPEALFNETHFCVTGKLIILALVFPTNGKPSLFQTKKSAQKNATAEPSSLLKPRLLKVRELRALHFEIAAVRVNVAMIWSFVEATWQQLMKNFLTSFLLYVIELRSQIKISRSYLYSLLYVSNAGMWCFLYFLYFL